jgi:hypothetical protein
MSPAPDVFTEWTTGSFAMGRVFLYYDGPLQFECVRSGQIFLECWYDTDDNFQRWVSFPLEKSDIDDYHEGRVGLRETMAKAAGGLCIVSDYNQDLKATYLARVDDVPALPDLGIYHDRRNDHVYP